GRVEAGPGGRQADLPALVVNGEVGPGDGGVGQDVVGQSWRGAEGQVVARRAQGAAAARDEVDGRSGGSLAQAGGTEGQIPASALVQVDSGEPGLDVDGPGLLRGVGGGGGGAGESEGPAGQVEGGTAAEPAGGVGGVIDQQGAANVDGEGGDVRGGTG